MDRIVDRIGNLIIFLGYLRCVHSWLIFFFSWLLCVSFCLIFNRELRDLHAGQMGFGDRGWVARSGITRSAKSQNNNWPKINKLINKIYKLRTLNWVGSAQLGSDWIGLTRLGLEWIGFEKPVITRAQARDKLAPKNQKYSCTLCQHRSHGHTEKKRIFHIILICK